MEFYSTKPRRLACEQAIYRRGYNTMKECSEACERHARKLGKDTTFNTMSIQNYVNCCSNLGVGRLKILADLLGVNNIMELDEKFVPPAIRNAGLEWIGDQGNIAKDMLIPRDLTRGY